MTALVKLLPAVLLIAAADQRIVPGPDLRVHDRTITGVYRLFDDSDGRSSGSRFERIDAMVRRGGFRFRGDAHDIVIRDVTLRLAAPQHVPRLPAGIEIQGTAHDILIERTVARDFQMMPEGQKYLNGDGFSSERGAYRITFRRDEAYDNSDGGFDLKSKQTRLDNTISARNKRNYRLWGTGTAGTIVSKTPRKAHIWLADTANWRIAHLVVKSSTPVPIVDSDGRHATLRVDSCDLDVPRGTKLAIGGGSISWGKGCVVP
ncbi:MAG TPA: hypothetical protein VFT56_14155 [Sphingomonas sp.]|nr:hypothetical protein [Sphingomonas sp.]